MPRALLPASLLLACCSQVSVSPDAGEADASGRDAGPSCLSLPPEQIDEGPLPEALRALPVVWDEPLELCGEWAEGEPLETVAAHKVHLTLAPAARSGLGLAALTGASVQGTIRRGPFFDSQFEMSEPSRSRVRRYQIGTDALTATVEHDLGAGGLLEQIGLFRAAGDVAPLRYGGEEVSFYFRPPGPCDGPLVRLRACEPAADLEDAAEALALRSTDGSAGGWLFAWRRSRTRPADAGTAPFVESWTEVSATGAFPARADGYWAQTYAAQHHNFDEHFRADFEADLRMYHTIFRPLAMGIEPYERGEVPLRFEVEHASGPLASPIAILETHEVGVAAPRVRRYSGSRAWVRVDDTAMQRLLEGVCSGGRVIGLTSAGNHTFQLLTCPGPGLLGFRLHALVPVFFGPDLDRLGLVVDESAMSTTVIEGKEWLRIPVGEHVVLLAPHDTPPLEYRLRILGPDGSTVHPVGAFPDYAFTASLMDTSPATIFPPLDETLIAHDAASGVSLAVVRRYVGQGAGNSGIYAPVSLELRFAGRTHRVEAWDRLEYTNTHHNEGDTLIARGAELTIRADVGWTPAVSAERPDGTVVLPPTALVREPRP